MSKVTECTLPSESKLYEYFNAGDFMDCFHVKTASKGLPVRTLANKAITNPPKVFAKLLKLRNRIVAPFGLRTENFDDANREGNDEDAIGIFPVVHEEENEIILGGDDKHLDFRLSLFRPSSDSQDVYVATWVHRHNIGGRLYLAAILPFHKLIVRNLTGRLG